MRYNKNRSLDGLKEEIISVASDNFVCIIMYVCEHHEASRLFIRASDYRGNLRINVSFTFNRILFFLSNFSILLFPISIWIRILYTCLRAYVYVCNARQEHCICKSVNAM